jgi:hypothetical protein
MPLFILFLQALETRFKPFYRLKIDDKTQKPSKIFSQPCASINTVAGPHFYPHPFQMNGPACVHYQYSILTSPKKSCRLAPSIHTVLNLHFILKSSPVSWSFCPDRILDHVRTLFHANMSRHSRCPFFRPTDSRCRLSLLKTLAPKRLFAVIDTRFRSGTRAMLPSSGLR